MASSSENVLSVPSDGMDEYLEQFQEVIEHLFQIYASPESLEGFRGIPDEYWSFLDSTDLPILKHCICCDSAPNAAQYNLEELLLRNVGKLELREISRNILQKIGKAYWVVSAMMAIYFVIERATSIVSNEEICADIFIEMFKQAICISSMKSVPQLSLKMVSIIEESVELLVHAAVLCSSQRRSSWLPDYICEVVTEKLMENVKDELQRSHRKIICELITNNARLINQQMHNGIQDSISMEQVIEMLEFENDKKNVVAVIVHGASGCGKTTITDSVFVGVKVQDYCNARFKLEDGEIKPSDILKMQKTLIDGILKNADEDYQGNIEEIEIDWDDENSVQSVLLQLLQNQYCFLYIENALKAEEIAKLLPFDLGNVKGLRILISAIDPGTEDHVLGVESSEDVKRFEVPPLPIEQARSLLMEEMGTDCSDCLSPEQIGKLINICKGVPLALKIVGRVIVMAEDRSEAFESIRKKGFCGPENEDFYAFAFDELKEIYRDAFLDICMFFHRHRWSYVKTILGEEILQVLEDRELIIKEPVDFQKRFTAEKCPEEDIEIKVPNVILNTARKVSKREGTRIRGIQQFKTLFHHEYHENLDTLCKLKGIFLVENEEEDDAVEALSLVLTAEQLEIMSGSLRIFSPIFMDVHNNFTGEAVIRVEGKCNCRFPSLMLYDNLWGDLPFDARGSHQLINLGFQPASTVDLSEMPESLISLNFTMEKQKVDRLPIIFNDCALPNLQNFGLQNSWCSVILEGTLSKLTSIKTLTIMNFSNLAELPDDLHELMKLETLMVANCRSLRGLPRNFGRCASLKTLNLFNCPEMKELPESVMNLANVKLEIVECGKYHLDVVFRIVEEARRNHTPVTVPLFGGMDMSFSPAPGPYQ